MQSKHLQEEYKNIYENFFAQQKIIFSAPFVLSRSGDTEAWYSWVSIKQKIPLRMYIWINSDPKPWINFGKIIYRDITEKKYLEMPIKEYGPYFHEIEKFLKQTWVKWDSWYKISLLCELPRWVGLWFDSVFCLLLSTCIHRLQGNFSHTEFDNNTLIYDDINNTKTSIYHIIRYAQLIESQIRWYQYISWALLTSLCTSKFPIISFSEDIQNTWKKELLSMQDYKCFIYPLNILFKDIWEIPHAPIDYWVIYSGRPTLSEHIVQENNQNEFIELMGFASNTFKEAISQSCANRKPKFHKELIKEYEKWNATIVQSLLWYNSFEILYRLKMLYHKWYSEEDIKKFILAITKTRHAHNAVKRSSSHLTALITGLQQFFWYRGDLLWISYNDTNSMWWSLFFTTPLEWLRKNILNTLNQAQRDFPWVELLYANRLDGIEEKWLLCEQDLLQQKTSQFVDNNMLMLELPNKNYIFWSYEHLIQQKDLDIVLDTVHMKIYTNWQKLTSKELHSQTWTIEMLLTALKNIGVDISNKELPISSYARSKNDMVGKIIIPLVKLIKEKVNKDLPLECYWWMYDYFLRLKNSSVKIGIVKRIGKEVVS